MQPLDKLNHKRLAVQHMQSFLSDLQIYDSARGERDHILQVNSHLEWLIQFYTDQTVALIGASHVQDPEAV